MTDEECDRQIEKLQNQYRKGKITIDEYIERVNSIQYGVDLFNEIFTVKFGGGLKNENKSND